MNRDCATDWDRDWWDEFIRLYAERQPIEDEVLIYKVAARKYADDKLAERQRIATTVSDTAERILLEPRHTADEVDRLLRLKHQ